MTREVTIRMTVDSSGAVSGLRVLQTEAAKTGKNLTETGKAADNSGSAIKNIAGAVDFAMKAFAALKAFDMVSDFVNQGRAINATSATFGALTANIGGATNTLQQLRDATGGVVTDLSLMQNSNRFLQMGLADTGEEAAKLAHIAVVLGGSMGKDAGGAMEEFALMLANQSIPRLDTFGISAGRVRTRINELMTETKGLTREQAFMQAVMETAEDSIDNLGPAADVAFTSLGRLETGFSNFINTVESRAADGAVALADLFQWLTNTHPIQQQFNAARQAIDDANLKDIMSDFGSVFGDLSPEQMQQIAITIRDMQQAAIDNPAIANNAQELARAALGVLEYEDTFNAIGDPGAELLSLVVVQRTAYNAMIREQDEAGKKMGDSIRNLGGILQSAPDFLITGMQNIEKALGGPERVAAISTARERMTVQYRDFFNTIRAMPQRLGGLGREMGTNLLEMMTPRLNALDVLKNVETNIMPGIETAVRTAFENAGGLDAFMQTDMAMPLLTGGLLNADQMQFPDLMTADQAGRIQDVFHMVDVEYERAKSLFDQGLITEDELQSASNMRDNVALMADEAERAATAFTNMSLTDLLGTTGGGVMGEISDLVLQTMKDAGMSEEAIAASQRQMDLASGRETMSSFALEEAIAPMLAQMQPGEQVLAMQNLTAAMEQLALQGGDINALTSEQIMGMTGFTGGSQGAGFEIKPGETLGEVQARLAQQGYQLAISDLLTATGATSTATVQPGQYNISQPGAVAGFDPLAYVQSLLNPEEKTGTATPFTIPTSAEPGGRSPIQDMWTSFMGSMGMGGGLMPAPGGATGTTLSMADTATDATTVSTAMDTTAMAMATMAEESIPAVNEAMTPLVDKSTILGDNFQNVYNQASQLTEQISTLTGQEYELVLNLKVKGDTATLYGINQAIAAGGGGGLATQVQNNNGRVPGADPRSD